MKYIIEIEIREKDIDGNKINKISILDRISSCIMEEWNVDIISIFKRI